MRKAQKRYSYECIIVLIKFEQNYDDFLENIEKNNGHTLSIICLAGGVDSKREVRSQESLELKSQQKCKSCLFCVS